MCKVSVIIPVFNGERFLQQCLDSVVGQTFHEIEIIIIDDGSTDQTKAICDQYVEIDERIKYFYQTKAGVSSARNFGLKVARAEYIVFVDSDDVVHLDFCQKLYLTIENSNADFVFCQMLPFEDKPVFSSKKIDAITYDKKAIYSSFIVSRIAFGKLDSWEKAQSCSFFQGIYKKEILIKKNIKFSQKLCVGEDWIFLMNYLLMCNIALEIKDVLYAYRFNEYSVMNRYKENYIENVIYYDQEIKNIIKQVYEYVNENIVQTSYYLNMAVLYQRALHNYRGNKKQLKKTITEMTKNRNIFKCFFSYAQNTKERLICFFVMFNLKKILLLIYQ